MPSSINNYLNGSKPQGIRIFLAGLLCILVAHQAPGQENLNLMDISPPDDDPQRTERIGPYRIIDNIYSVSARVHYPSFLITSTEGHMIIDTSFEEMVPDILENIEQLGFDPRDVKYLLAHHSHIDHVSGHAAMKEATGAMVMASAPDADVMESGGRTDFRDRGVWRPVMVDRIIEDLDRIRLGDTVLTAHITPGHSKGCTTWTTVAEEDGREYDVVFFCGMRFNPDEAIVGNPEYPDMAAEFAYGFAKLKALPVDIYLAGHGYWFGFKQKLLQLEQGTGGNPFIDPEGFRYKVNSFERAYIKQLQIERGILDSNTTR